MTVKFCNIGGDEADNIFKSTAELVQAFQLDPSVNMMMKLNNPTVQRYYHVVQAVALTEDLGKQKLDDLDELWPDKSIFTKNFDTIENFKKVLDLQSLGDMTAPVKVRNCLLNSR